MDIKSNKRCRTLTKSNQQCQKHKLWGSQYCWWHQPKSIPLITLIVGALLGVFFNVVREVIYPPKSEVRRMDVVDRITIEADQVINLTNFFLEYYLTSIDKKDLFQELKETTIEDASKHHNSRLRKELEIVFANPKILRPSGSINEKGESLPFISFLYWSLNNTKLKSDIFLNKYGSVDHRIVTTISKMITQANMVLMILNEFFKNPEKLKFDFENGKVEQFTDFLSSFYLYQLECKTLIEKEKFN